MTQGKTSAGIKQLLSRAHWDIPGDTRKKMLYEYLNRNTPCYACRRCTLRSKGLEENFYYCCSESLTPREGCLLFELDKSKVIVDEGIVNPTLTMEK